MTQRGTPATRPSKRYGFMDRKRKAEHASKMSRITGKGPSETRMKRLQRRSLHFERDMRKLTRFERIRKPFKKTKKTEETGGEDATIRESEREHA